MSGLLNIFFGTCQSGKCFFKITSDHMKVKFSLTFFCDDRDIGVQGKLFIRKTKNLPNKPFDPISINSPTHFATYRHSQPSGAIIRHSNKKNKMPTINFTAGIRRNPEIPPVLEPMLGRKSISISRHVLFSNFIFCGSLPPGSHDRGYDDA